MHLLLCGKGWGASLLEKIYLKHNKREREPSIPLQELSFYKLWFSNFCIFLTKCGRPYMFQTMNFVSSNNLSLKSGWIDLGIRRFEFVAKTQYLWFFLWIIFSSRKSSDTQPVLSFDAKIKKSNSMNLEILIFPNGYFCSSGLFKF